VTPVRLNSEVTNQTTQATADTASVIATVVPRAVVKSGRGLARHTVTITAARPHARTKSINRVTLTIRAPVAGSRRVTKPITPYS
jgi:hypothetical protein